jgi:hypothetical protein
MPGSARQLDGFVRSFSGKPNNNSYVIRIIGDLEAKARSSDYLTQRQIA